MLSIGRLRSGNGTLPLFKFPNNVELDFLDSILSGDNGFVDESSDEGSDDDESDEDESDDDESDDEESSLRTEAWRMSRVTDLKDLK